MARNWKDIRADAVKSGRLDEQGVANAKKSMREEIRAVKLADLRRARDISQVDLAEVMGVKQPRVSAIERGELSKAELGTLESYVESLGGHLRVVADFGDETLTLRD